MHIAFLLPALAAALGTYCVAKELCSKPLLAALVAVLSLIMSRNSFSCESVMEPKATEATLKPYTGHRLGTDSGLQSHTNATPRLPQGHPKTTFKPANQTSL